MPLAGPSFVASEGILDQVALRQLRSLKVAFNEKLIDEVSFSRGKQIVMQR
jgi:hypothetical protein